MSSKGRDREKNLTKDRYFTDTYFRIQELYSASHQIHDIHSFSPDTVMEIGKGNGFVSTYLKMGGIDVVTVDINPNLEPDICADIQDIPQHLAGRTFDLVSCCEVLEHLPFAEFEQSLDVIAQAAPNAYISIPHNMRRVGLLMFLDLPKIPRQQIDLSFRLPVRRKPLEEHYWELSSSPECSVDAVTRILQRYYDRIEQGYYEMFTFHHYFKCYGSRYFSG